MSDLPEWVRAKQKKLPFTNGYSFAGLFSGCGGLDLGALLAGFKPVYAADYDPVAVETYQKNIGEHVHCVDLANTTID